MKDSINNLATNLKYFRYNLKLSQEKFAEALDTNLQYENQLENGRRNPTLKMLDKLSYNISKLIGYEITSSDLINYDKKKLISSNRIDKK